MGSRGLADIQLTCLRTTCRVRLSVIRLSYTATHSDASPLLCSLRALGQALCTAPNNAQLSSCNVFQLPAAGCLRLRTCRFAEIATHDAYRLTESNAVRCACSDTLQVLWKLLFPLQLVGEQNHCYKTRSTAVVLPPHMATASQAPSHML